MSCNIGIFGGSFDPIHIGHRRIIEAALSKYKFSKFYLMPTSGAEYKERFLSLAGHRYALCSLAIEDLPEVKLSRLELKQTEEPNYTANTVKLLGERLEAKGIKKYKLFLIYGSDALEYFERWYKPEKILKRASLLIALRGNDHLEAEKYYAKARYLEEKYGGTIEFFPMESIEISSTQLRSDLQEDIVERRYYPPGVANFLKQHKIYKFYKDFQNLSPETHAALRRFENILWSQMPFRRLIHSENVSLYACHLAAVHGVDPNKAAIAGLLHDACKNIPLHEQYEYASKSGFMEELNDKLVHGPASAYWLREVLEIEDQDIYDAVMYHTTARPQMPDLEKILYLADKIEFGRSFADLPEIRTVAEKDLDAALVLCFIEVIDAMGRRGQKLHPLSKQLIEELSLKYDLSELSAGEA